MVQPEVPVTFVTRNWPDVFLALFLAVCGVGLLTDMQPGFKALGVALLLLGVFAAASLLVARRIELSDAGVTVSRLFRPSLTYGWTEVSTAIGDGHWIGYPHFVPTLVLRDGRRVRLWSFSQPGFRWFLRLQPPKRGNELIAAINGHLGFKVDASSG